MWRSFILIVLLLFSPVLNASELSFSQNARTFESQTQSLFIKGLAFACLNSTQIPDDLPCNPALLTYLQKESLSLQALISNGSSNLEKIKKLLNQSSTQDTIDALFSKERILQIESHASLLFRSKYFAAQYLPVDIKGFSVVRNEANPDVEFYAVEDKGFRLQAAYPLTENLTIGLQSRLTDRKFIRQRFKLTDLATPAGKNLLTPKTYNFQTLEPSFSALVYQPWKVRISMMYANAGRYSERYDQIDPADELQGGISITPELLPWGELLLSLDYKSLTAEDSSLDKLHYGVSYSFGSMSISGGIDTHGISSGVFFSIQSISAGILYTTTKGLGDDSQNYTQTVYAQVGWQI